MKTNKINLEKLDSEYLSTKEEASKFGAFVVNELNQALLNNGVEISFSIQMRVKKWDSIKEKLNRVSLNIGSITDFQDLIGLRLIVLFPRDAAKVGTIISKLLR